VEAASSLRASSALLDGELAVFLPSGLSSFQGLQNALHNPAGSRPLVYSAFDLLHLDGRDLRKTPLEERKARLADLLAKLGPTHPIKYINHIVGDGPRVFARATELGVEGIVSKRRRSVYREGRTRDWLKTKCWRSSEFVVCGYRLHAERASALSELLVGYHDTSGRFHFAGAVGTGRGFGHSFRAQLRSELDAFAQPSSRVSSDSKVQRRTHALGEARRCCRNRVPRAHQRFSVAASVVSSAAPVDASRERSSHAARLVWLEHLTRHLAP